MLMNYYLYELDKKNQLIDKMMIGDLIVDGYVQMVYYFD